MARSKLSKGAAPRLDGGYTAFGRIVERPEEIAGFAETLGKTVNGFEFFHHIVQYDIILSVEIFETSR
jgi:hypothetical protein